MCMCVRVSVFLFLFERLFFLCVGVYVVAGFQCLRMCDGACVSIYIYIYVCACVCEREKWEE